MNRNVSIVLLVTGIAGLALGLWVLLLSEDTPPEVPYRPPAETPAADQESETPPLMPTPSDPPPPPEDEGLQPLPPPEDPEPKKPDPAPVDEAAAIVKMKAKLEGCVFSLKVDDLTVSAALGLIAALAGVEINTNLADADRLEGKVSFAFDETPVLDALDFVCQVKGLAYEVGPRGIVIK